MSFPENVQPIDKKSTFRFRCHTKVQCFNECCRELELALTPYDVLRLREGLNLSSAEFLDRHAIVEFTENHPYPFVYLGMVDDGRASCPFVAEQGCLVYHERPGACRTYPVGRGASMLKDKQVNLKYVLIREPHCLGFNDQQEQTIEEWEKDQEIILYNKYNDQLMSLTQHPMLRRGMQLSKEQADLFITALYDLDTFRKDPLFLDYMHKKNPKSGDSFDNIVILENAIEILSKELFK